MLNPWKNFWEDSHNKDPYKMTVKAYAEYLIGQVFGWAFVIGIIFVVMFLYDLYLKIASFFS